MTTIQTVNGECVVYSRPEVRKFTGTRGISFIDCTTTEKIDTNGDGTPDNIDFRLVTMLDRKGAVVCYIWTATGPEVNLTVGTCK